MTEADLIIPADKGTHFIVGALIFLFVVGLAWGHASGPRWALLVVALAAGAKELADLLRNRVQVAAGDPPTHDPSWGDFAATFAGGLVCFLSVLAA